MELFCKESSCGATLTLVDSLYVCKVCGAKYVVNFHGKPLLIQKGIKQKFLLGDRVIVCATKERAIEVLEGVRKEIKQQWLNRVSIKVLIKVYNLPYAIIAPIVKEARKERNEKIIQEVKTVGLTAANKFGLTRTAVSDIYRKATGIRVSMNAKRDAEICRLRKDGQTLQKIGERFVISRERVRQVLLSKGMECD